MTVAADHPTTHPLPSRGAAPGAGDGRLRVPPGAVRRLRTERRRPQRHHRCGRAPAEGTAGAWVPQGILRRQKIPGGGGINHSLPTSLAQKNTRGTLIRMPGVPPLVGPHPRNATIASMKTPEPSPPQTFLHLKENPLLAPHFHVHSIPVPPPGRGGRRSRPLRRATPWTPSSAVCRAPGPVAPKVEGLKGLEVIVSIVWHYHPPVAVV